MGLDHDKGGTMDLIGWHNAPTGRGGDHAVVPGAGKEVDADEVGDIPGPGSRADVGEGVGVDRIVGDEEAGTVEGREMAAEITTNVVSGAGVKGRQRLVEEEEPWFGQGSGQGHALGLTTRQLTRPMVAVVPQPEPRQPRRGCRSGRRRQACPCSRCPLTRTLPLAPLRWSAGPEPRMRRS